MIHEKVRQGSNLFMKRLVISFIAIIFVTTLLRHIPPYGADVSTIRDIIVAA